MPSRPSGSVVSSRPRADSGWVLLPPASVPDRWRGRAMELLLVPLLPGEDTAFLDGTAATPAVDAVDERVADLAARGLSATAISQELAISTRSAYRRLAGLRRRLGVSSSAELAGELSRRGFGGR